MNLHYPHSINVNKCRGSYPYAKLCVLDVVENKNVKLFNLM